MKSYATFIELFKKEFKKATINIMDSDYPEPQKVQNLVDQIITVHVPNIADYLYEQLTATKVSSPAYTIGIISDILPFVAGDMVIIKGHEFPAVIDEVVIRDSEILFRWTEFNDSKNEVTIHNNGTFNLEDVNKTVFPHKPQSDSPDTEFTVVINISEVITPKTKLVLNKELSDIDDVLQGIQARRIIGVYKDYAAALKAYESHCKTASSVYVRQLKDRDGSVKHKYHIQTVELCKINYNEQQETSGVETIKVFFRDVSA